MSWKVVKLGELIENFSVKAKDYDVDVSTLDFFGVSNTEGITKSKYAAKDKADDYKIMEKGCFAYNPYRINVGSIAMLNKDIVGLISPAYVVFKVKERSIIPELLLKFLKSSEGLRQIKLHARGTVRQALRFSDLCEIKIALPDYNEQLELYKKISKTEIESNILSTELTHQLDTVKKLRQAFLREAMQGKLTEDWRASQKTPPLLGEVPKADGLKKLTNLPHLKTFRKQLRKNSTPAEAKLWTMLKGKQLEGRKFRRQFSVANYILDFYCPSEKLAIELDGQGHFEAAQAEYDRERDLFLLHTGIKVLRFENKWVWDNPEGLLREIKSNFKTPQSAKGGQLPFQGEQLEDARDLLAKIKAEKEKLIKEKKIRKPKPLPPITQKEIPFEIPENWVWTRLGLPIFYTENLDIQKKLSAETVINYVDIDCIDNSKQIIREVKTKRVSELSTRARRILKKGFIIYSTVRPYLRNIAIVEEELPQMIGTTGFNVFKPILVNTKYIFYFLLNPDLNNKFEKMMVGFNSPSITNVQFENTLLPLPPLPEQKAIVAKLDELMGYCDSLEESIKNSQTQNEMLLQQVLREALEPKDK